MNQRPPILRASFDSQELIVDCFAGGGGASTGIAAALGRDPDIAINHSAIALAMHRANHPRTRHYQENVWRVDPIEACAGRPVGLLWISPDCTHHSRAKGGKPRKKKIRGLAWAAVRWAHDVRPRVICLENVSEFEEWGPLLPNDKPDPARLGQTFRAFVRKLRKYGYAVEWRTLVAADYGAPTTRERLFLVARSDGLPIVWPEPTHGEGRSRPWRAAHEIIDWSLPIRSIFGRKKPLVHATERRIFEGLRRHVIESPRPFIVSTSRGLVAPSIVKAFGGPNGNRNAGVHVGAPLGAVTARDHHWLVAAWLTKMYGTSHSASVQMPLPTVTGSGNHLFETRAFLVKWYGAKSGQQQSLFEPLHTVTAKARFGLVAVNGEPHAIADIGLRMLEPSELFAAHVFPPSYVIDECMGRTLTKEQQTFCVGNSVPPVMAEAIVGAQFGTREAVAA